MTKEDKEFIWELLPDWVKNTKPGLDATMYGTGSYISDLKLIEEVKRIMIEQDL